MNTISKLKQLFMFQIASALRYISKKIFYKFEIILEEKIDLRLRKKYQINGRFKSNTKLEKYLISIKECAYGNTHIFVDKFFFRVQKCSTKKINNCSYSSFPKLVVRFVRDFRMK